MLCRHKLFLILCIVSSSVLAHHPNLIIPGSTTAQKRVLGPAEKIIKKQTGIAISVLGVGSGNGFKELLTGKAQVAVVSTPLSVLLDQFELADDGSYQEHCVTEDQIVPIVHPSNPVDRLSHRQLAELNTGKIRNWKEVGGDDLPVVVVTSHTHSGTRAMFKQLVMQDAAYIEQARTVRSTHREVDLVAKFKGGIGAVSRSFADMGAGRIKIVRSPEIKRPLCFVTKGKPDHDVAKVLDFLKTPEAQRLFQ